MEIIFDVYDAEEGGYDGRAIGCSIFTQADTWDEMKKNILEVTSLHFEDEINEPEIVVTAYYVRGSTSGGDGERLLIPLR